MLNSKCCLGSLFWSTDICVMFLQAAEAGLLKIRTITGKAAPEDVIAGEATIDESSAPLSRVLDCLEVVLLARLRQKKSLLVVSHLKWPLNKGPSGMVRGCLLDLKWPDTRVWVARVSPFCCTGRSGTSLAILWSRVKQIFPSRQVYQQRRISEFHFRYCGVQR